MSSIEGKFTEYSICSNVDINKYDKNDQNLDFVLKRIEKYKKEHEKNPNNKYLKLIKLIKLIYSYDKPS